MKLTQIMNETTRRSNDFFNDSKHGKAIYKLLGGKPFRASVVKDYLERILGKLGDVKGIRAIEFIGKNVGIDSRKYDNKPTRDFIFAVMDGIEALYKSHLDESLAKKTITENQENRPLSNEVKKHFLEIVSTYNKYQEMMDRKSDLATVAETLGGITEAARTLAIHEGDDWFDKHTIKRNMSELDKLGKEFDKCAKEATSLDQRLGGLYEDMGNILSRYYKIGEITEEQMKDRLGMNESVGCGCGGTTESTCGCGTHTHESINEGKFKVDDLVYNKKTKTVGIVRIGDDKYGEVKTDADGNVDVDELEKYNPIKFKHQAKAKAAPSTEKEINKRGLFNPFKNESVNESKESDIIDSFIKDLDNTRGIVGAGSSDWGSDRIADIGIELKGTKNSYHRKHGSLYDTFDLDLRKVKPVITQLAKKHNLKIVGRVYTPKKYNWKDEFNSNTSGYEHNRVSFSVQIPRVNESVNESASKEAMGIAGFTGTRGSAVEDFITKNELNGKKLFNFIRKGSLKDRMDFVTAIAGNPGNKIQKMIISKFKLGESVNEKADPKKFRKGFVAGDVIVNDDNSRYVIVAQRGKQFIVGDNGERRESLPGGKFGKKKLKGNLSLKDVLDESVNEENPGLWANIRAKQKRGEKPAHKNSQAHKDAVKAGKKINKEESVVSEAKFGYKDSTASYINNHKDEFKIAEKLNKGNEVKFYDSLSQMEEKIGHPKFMIFLSNALRGYKVDMYKDPKIKNPQDAQEALFLLSK